MPPPRSTVEEQNDQRKQGMSQLKLVTIIITGIVVLAGLGGAIVFLGVRGLIDAAEEEFQNELSEGPPPSLPQATWVVDDIETLADFGYRKIDTVAHANAGDFIQFRLEDLGYEVEIQNFTTQLCEDCRNYVATIEGEDSDSWIVVGGHYDAICYSQQVIIGIEYPGCTSEGAYDDATGVASVLELARLMKEWQQLAWDEFGIELKPEHTWKFAAWDYEEWQGSGSPEGAGYGSDCLLYTSPSPRDRSLSRMPSSA